MDMSRSPGFGLSEYEETLALLQQIALLDGLDEAQMAPLAQEARLVVLLKGRILFHAGEHPRYFYLLANGSIRLFQPETDSPRPRVIGILQPGDGICDAATIQGKPYCFSAEASVDSRLIAVSRLSMMRLLESGGPLTMRMLQALSQALLENTQLMLELNGHTGLRRVACYLLHFSPRLDTRGYEMTLPMSKQAVASHLGMAKETFSRTLRELREAGIIQVSGRTIAVLDTARLRDLRH